jgi:integral membrane sensor domain MASE1
VAAVGAGLEVAVEVSGHHTEASDSLAGWVVAVPVALAMVLIWVLNAPLPQRHEVRAVVVVPAAMLVLAAPVTTGSIGLAGVVALVALLTAADEALYEAKSAGRAQAKSWVEPFETDGEQITA